MLPQWFTNRFRQYCLSFPGTWVDNPEGCGAVNIVHSEELGLVILTMDANWQEYQEELNGHLKGDYIKLGLVDKADSFHTVDGGFTVKLGRNDSVYAGKTFIKLPG